MCFLLGGCTENPLTVRSTSTANALALAPTPTPTPTPTPIVFCPNNPSLLEGKKLIEFGGDEPDPAYMLANIQTMEQDPFNGLVFVVNDDVTGAVFMDSIWNDPFPMSHFQQSLADLQATHFSKFTDRFLRINSVVSSDFDWFDDNHWQNVVLPNFVIAATIAQQSGAKGFWLDTESYDTPTWNFDNTLHPDKSVSDYQAEVELRGQQLAQAINAIYPNITIVMTYGIAGILYSQGGGDLSYDPYQLLPSFIDGMLSGSTPTTSFVDGFESSYTFLQGSQFISAYNQVHDVFNFPAAFNLPTSFPQQYLAKTSAGFGIYTDGFMNQISTEYGNDGSLEYQNSINCALQTSDKYVWIYSDKPNWWTKANLPDDYYNFLGSLTLPADFF